MTSLLRASLVVSHRTIGSTEKRSAPWSACEVGIQFFERNGSQRRLASTSNNVLSSSVASVNDPSSIAAPEGSKVFPTLADPELSAPDVKLYQYQICPFCNYAKAVLSFADLGYDAVEVNPLTKAELKWSTDYKKVPIAMVAGEQLNGSDTIVSAVLKNEYVTKSLERKWDGAAMSMEQFAESESAKRWTAFATDDLAPLLYPNLCNTMGNSYRAFDYVNNVNSFSTVQRIMIQSVGSVAMYLAASKIKKKRNITDVREALMGALDTLESDGLQSGKQEFLSGTGYPNLGDVAVFGALKGLEGLEVHQEVLGSRSGSDGGISPLAKWYGRMNDLVYKKD